MDDAFDDFESLMARVRNGDAAAAAVLIKSCETELRIIIRARLRDPRLCRVVDSIDVCQSVLGNFFVRASAGQFELHSADDLLRLLSRMVRNKISDHARREYAQSRDAKRTSAEGVEEVDPAGDQATPSQIVQAKELESLFFKRLSAEDRAAVDARRAGATWEEIAERQGASAEAVRKRVNRAIDEVAGQLGLERPE